MLAPLLRIEAVPDADLGAPPWAAILITSANGARALAGHPRRGELLALPVLAVGRSSADAARAAGFADVIVGRRRCRRSRAACGAALRRRRGRRCFISPARTAPANWPCRASRSAPWWSIAPPRPSSFRPRRGRRWSRAASTACCISPAAASRAISNAAATSSGRRSSPRIIACRRGPPSRCGRRRRAHRGGGAAGRGEPARFGHAKVM